jgi:excisionase family DNA binding protein
MTKDKQAHIMIAQEIDNLLRVHRSTATRLALSGALKSHQIGNRRLFKSTDVWTFFENQVSREYASKEA